MFLIGNKTDLESYRVVKTEDGKKMQTDFNLDLFVESSAKSGFNTEYTFVEAAKLLYNDYIKYKIGNPLIGRGKAGKLIKKEEEENKKKKVCC